MNKNYGFIPSVIDPDTHYILGDGMLTPPVLMPNGHGWGAYLPTDDFQSNSSLETDNCTNYGTLHALATLGKKKFGPQFQTALSERYTGVMTGTTQGGNDPHKVIELIRTACGVVPAVFLPFDTTIKTWKQYYSPSPMSYALYAIGAHWLKKYKISHQWVTLPSDNYIVMQHKMMTALQFSPLCASVFAWSQHNDGKYYSDQPYQNHWIEVYDYVEGDYWMIFDSYDNTHKKLDWKFTFGQVKGYGLDFNTGGQALGEEAEAVYLPYVGYLIQNLLGLNK